MPLFGPRAVLSNKMSTHTKITSYHCEEATRFTNNHMTDNITY